MQVTTRLYRDGALARTGFPFDDVSELRQDQESTIWVDLLDPDRPTLQNIADELSLHPLAVEDVFEERERTKLMRYDTHFFLTLYGLGVPDDPHEDLLRQEVDVFIAANVLVTVRHDGQGFPIEQARQACEAQPGLLKCGSIALLWAILDVVVDSHFDVIQVLDERLGDLEDDLFENDPDTVKVRRGAYRLHKHLLSLRRLALPTHEIVRGVMTRSQPGLPDVIVPYFQDVYDHTLRVADWADTLRDLASTIVDTNLATQSNRMNLAMKKLSGWAAIIAVPTLVTGFFGMNVLYPMVNTAQGAVVSTVIAGASSLILYVQFKRKDWL